MKLENEITFNGEKLKTGYITYESSGCKMSKSSWEGGAEWDKSSYSTSQSPPNAAGR